MPKRKLIVVAVLAVLLMAVGIAIVDRPHWIRPLYDPRTEFEKQLEEAENYSVWDEFQAVMKDEIARRKAGDPKTKTTVYPRR